jgi:hypothetical protein
VDYTTGSYPDVVTIGDIDGDEKPDLAVTNYTSSYSNGTVSILQNQSTSGNISFTAKVDYTTGSSPYSVAIGDVDGDGKPDLAVTNYYSSTVSILRNTIFSSNAPTTPKNLIATAGNGQITLKWNKNTEADFLKYRIYMGTDSVNVSLKDSTTASILDTSKIITGLTNGTKYYFRVTAVNSSGLESGYSNEVNAVPSSIPTVTTNVATNITETSVTLKGSVNPNGLATTAWFDIERTSTLQSYDSTAPQSVGSGTNVVNVSVIFSPLIPTATYYYRVVGQNSAGTQRGSILSFTALAGVAAPQNLTANPGNGQVTLKWSMNTESDFLRYRIYRGTSPSVTILSDSTIAGIADTSKIITGLTNGTTYYFRITAVDSARNQSEFSNEASATPTSNPILAVNPATLSFGGVVVSTTSPEKTYSLFGTNLSPTSGNITVTAPTSFEVSLTSNSGFASSINVPYTNGTLSTTIYVHFKPVSLIAYSGNITNTGGGAPAQSVSVSGTGIQQITVPAAPTNLSASVISGSQIDLSWTDVSNNEDGFKIERKVGTGGPYALMATLDANVQSYSNTGLTDLTTYYYRVYAYNSAGNSGYSNEVNATTPDVTPPVAPTAVQIVPSGWTNQSTFNITWTNPSDPSGIAKLWYIIDTIPTVNSPGTAIASSAQTLQVNISSVGTHQIYFYLEDGAGNKDPNNRAQVRAKYDNVAPVIQHDSTAVAKFETASPQAIAIQATAADAVSGMKSLQLFYRRAGVSWSSAQSSNYLSASGGTINIPASYISSNSLFGVDYRIAATDSANSIIYTPTHSLVIHNSTAVTRSDQNGNPVAQISAGSLPSGTPKEYAYRILSIPLILDNRTPQDVLENRSGLGAYDENKWRFFRLDANDQFEEYSTFASQQIIDPGKAFFLILKDAITIKSGPGTVPKSEDINKDGIALKAGYNAIGNPFNFDVPIDSLSLATGELLKNKTVWEYVGVGGTNGGWKLGPTTLKAWEGIVANIGNSGPTILRFNIADRPSAVMSSSKPTMLKKELVGTNTKENRWSLRIRAEREDNKIDDSENIIGVDPMATDDVDTLDVFEPPLLGDKSISLSFNSKEGALTHDYRAPGAEGYVWDIKLKTPDENAKTVLTFDGIGSMSQNNYLINIESKMVYRIVEKQQLMINTGKGTRNFRLIVGSKAFAEANSMGIDLFPTNYVLYQNYPNPFNPSTMIRFSLPAKSNVKLMIYDLLGRELVRLIDREMSEGYQEVEWKANMSTGIYFYRLEATSLDNSGKRFVEVRKMVLMK